MATLATGPAVSPRNRMSDLPMRCRQVDRRVKAEWERPIVQVGPQEVSLRSTLPVFALGLLALLATAIWPMLFVAVVVLLAALAPAVAVFLAVLAALRRNSDAIE